MDSTADFYYNQSKKHFNNKNYNDALNIIQKAINLDNNNVNYWLLLTEIYLVLKQFNLASSSSLTAINYNPNCATAWYLRSKVLIGLTRYDEALNTVNKAINIDKNNADFIELNKNIQNFLKSRDLITKKEFESSNNHNNNVNSQSSKSDGSSQSSSVNSKNPEAGATSQTNDNLKDYEFNPLNKYNNIFRLISSKNLKLFKDKKFNSKIYYSMLDKVMGDVLKKYKHDNSLDIYNKLLKFASYFAEVKFKSEGEEDGLYACNVIQVDDRRKITHQIAAIIHELAHHLLSEIFEQSLMYIFDSVKTDAIESFAWYTINFKDEYQLMNEYCAHCVENYFMPFNYNNFESFNKVLEKFNLNDNNDLEKIKNATILGNTFSQDIIYMLNKFIKEDFKKDIKIRYVKDGFIIYSYKGTKFKTDSFVNDDVKFDLINSIFSETLIHVKTHFAIPTLLNYKYEFNKVNRRR